MKKGRFLFIFVVFMFVYATLSLRLYIVQVQENGFLSLTNKTSAESGNKLGEQKPKRGQIFFTDVFGKDVPIAFTRDYPEIFVSPKEIVDPASAGKVLSGIIGKDAIEIETEIS